MNRLGSTRSVTLLGLEGHVVDVQASVSDGLPKVTITGHADSTVTEGKERVVAALACAGTGSPPPPRVTLNLAPAWVRKSGTALDLAMAVAVLVACGHVPDRMRQVVHLGELGLDGRVLPVRGVLPAVRAAADAGTEVVVVPAGNLAEARLVPGPRCVAVSHLRELVALYQGREVVEEPPVATAPIPPAATGPDLADVAGQDQARFALEVAAAGAHHLFLLGPPGAGKTMLAERLPGLLPPLDEQEALEVTAIASLMGRLGHTGGLVTRAPFEAVHHGVTIAALTGGGTGYPRPGAVTAAHRGVLFIDEAPQMGFAALNSLRQPLETGAIEVRRADATARYPARFQLVAAANPCPCGKSSGKGLDCTCSSKARRDYLGRISGPLLDRIDIQLTVPRVTRAQLAGPKGESSAVVAARVAAARDAQRERLSAIAEVSRPVNALVPGHVLRRGALALPPAVVGPLDRALELGRLTLRGYDRTLRIAWTVADLDGRHSPGLDDVATALTLRTSIGVTA